MLAVMPVKSGLRSYGGLRAFRSMTWWKVMIIGMCASGVVVTMQFIYKRGFAEVDDVMHNTVGCLIGYGIYSLVRQGYEKVFKRNMAVL